MCYFCPFLLSFQVEFSNWNRILQSLKKRLKNRSPSCFCLTRNTRMYECINSRSFKFDSYYANRYVESISCMKSDLALIKLLITVRHALVPDKIGRSNLSVEFQTNFGKLDTWYSWHAIKILIVIDYRLIERCFRNDLERIDSRNERRLSRRIALWQLQIVSICQEDITLDRWKSINKFQFSEAIIFRNSNNISLYTFIILELWEKIERKINFNL